MFHKSLSSMGCQIATSHLVVHGFIYYFVVDNFNKLEIVDFVYDYLDRYESSNSRCFQIRIMSFLMAARSLRAI